VTVEGDPLAVLACHCDACQQRSGSVFAVNAQFDPAQVVEISGESARCNGLELDGVGVAGSDEIGIDFHFCPTCGSTVYRTMGADPPSFFAIGVGCFVEPEFPIPVAEMHTALRHHWVAPVPDAAQFDAFPGG
jgi:hypothetical protein